MITVTIIMMFLASGHLRRASGARCSTLFDLTSLSTLSGAYSHFTNKKAEDVTVLLHKQ